MGWGRGSHSFPKDWKRIAARIKRRDPQCRIAGPRCTKVSTEVDHVIPVFEGGTHDDDNLQGACHACHAEKTARESARARAARPRPSRLRPVERHPGEL